MIPRRLLEPTRDSASRSGYRRELDRRALAILVDIDPSWRYSPVGLWLMFSAVAVFLGARTGGVVLASVACVASMAAPPAAVRMARAKRAQRVRDHLPNLADEIARASRSGLPLGEAVARAVDANPRRVSSQTSRMILEWRRGRPLDEALSSWLESKPERAESFVAQALLIGSRSGGSIGRSLDRVSETVRAELNAARRQRALTQQARYSARVLAGLPVGVAATVSMLSDEPMYRGVSGAIVMLGGGGLAVVGFVWMSWLIRRVSA